LALSGLLQRFWRRRTIRGVPTLASLAMLLQTSPARCQAAEERYKVGVYVTSIHAIDAAAGTYAADLWIRSVGTWPRGTRFKPWNSLTQTA